MSRLRLLACLPFIAASAFAQNLIVNGDFESLVATEEIDIKDLSFGDYLTFGWTVSGDAAISLYPSDDFSTGQYVTFGDGERDAAGAEMQQIFATQIGQVYEVSFNVGRVGPGGAVVGVTGAVFGGNNFNTTLGELTGYASPAGESGGTVWFSPVSFTFTAVSELSLLRFSDTSNTTLSVDTRLDNVSVTAVPEPSAFAALAGGFALAGALLRRRRR